MSDWCDPASKPTICIDFPWQERPVAYCLNCSQQVSNVNAQRHAIDPYHMPACGIEFQFVTTRAADKEWQEFVAGLRPDLLYTHEGTRYE